MALQLGLLEVQFFLIGALVCLLTSFVLHLIFFKGKSTGASTVAFPRGPPAWPILGHLPLLQSGCPHHTLASLSQSLGYGPIIGLRLGSRPAVVVSSVALAKDILLTHDKVFASRPPYQFADSLYYGYDSAVVYSSYSSHWAKLRKIYTLHLFTAKRLHDLQGIRQEELARLLRSLLEASGHGTRVLDVGKFTADMSSNTISRLLQSKPISFALPHVDDAACRGDSLRDLVTDLEHETAPTLGDFIPWLKCLDMLQMHNMKRLHDCFDKVIEAILCERREAMRSSSPEKLPHDFLQVLLSEEITSDATIQKEKLTTREIKGIILDILGAGISTTTLTLEWAMAELLRNPRCLQKLREEIDAMIGSKSKGPTTQADAQLVLVDEDDLPKLPYLEKVVKEVFRLHPPVPLLLPRISSEACSVDKYLLPKGTHVFVNVWAIGRDAEVWENAESFWPERFDEGKDDQRTMPVVDLKGNDYELLPFGSGRRMCPALRLGLSVVQATLANLVHAFTWELPPGQTPSTMDMTERRGITGCKACPVLAIPKPRFPRIR